MRPTFNQIVAVFLCRVLLGFIFFMQGFHKVFKWGIDNLYQQGFQSYEAILPKFLVLFAVYFTSYVELIGGLFLVLGLFRDYTLYALGLVLIIVTFGHGLQEGIWDLQHVFFRAVLLITLLLLPKKWDKWQAQYVVSK